MFLVFYIAQVWVLWYGSPGKRRQQQRLWTLRMA